MTDYEPHETIPPTLAERVAALEKLGAKQQLTIERLFDLITNQMQQREAFYALLHEVGNFNELRVAMKKAGL